MELQDNVVERVFLCTSCPLKYWIAVAVAVALFPLLEDDLLLIVQVEAVAFAVEDAAVQVDEPFPYEKLREYETFSVN